MVFLYFKKRGESYMIISGTLKVEEIKKGNTIKITQPKVK
nr:MAG TPA: hypothetical protein [Caudoviricetes sp.]